jgi:quercetin dioxygenase-like cupin family protein
MTGCRTSAFWAGLMTGILISIAATIAPRFVVSANGLAGQSTKPSYKIALENDRVRVRDVTFPPGVLDTGMHTHEYAHVGVILTKGTLVFTDAAGKVDKVAFEAGSVGFREAKATHMVANPGPEPMRVIEVELK